MKVSAAFSSSMGSKAEISPRQGPSPAKKSHQQVLTLDLGEPGKDELVSWVLGELLNVLKPTDPHELTALVCLGRTVRRAQVRALAHQPPQDQRQNGSAGRYVTIKLAEGFLTITSSSAHPLSSRYCPAELVKRYLHIKPKVGVELQMSRYMRCVSTGEHGSGKFILRYKRRKGRKFRKTSFAAEEWELDAKDDKADVIVD